MLTAINKLWILWAQLLQEYDEDEKNKKMAFSHVLIVGGT